MENNYQEQELLFKAFCDINRLKIINYLQTGEKCACVLLAKLQVTQPTLSHHMKILENSGVIKVRKEGKWRYYSLAIQQIVKAQKYLQKLQTVEEIEINVNNSCLAKKIGGEKVGK